MDSKSEKLKRNVKKDILSNGLTIITEEIPYVESISINMGVRCGSRHEAPGLEGMAHLVEHMLFKGTKSIPSPSKISELIEISGGSLNAATDYETTVYWCRVLSEKAEESLQLLFQLITEPLLRPVDLELERKVIIEEINSVNDFPNSRADVLLDELMWPGTSLGRDIAGTIETVSNLSHESLVRFIKEKYNSNSVVISAAGNLNHNEVIDIVGPMSETLNVSSDNIFNKINYTSNKPTFIREDRVTEQAHISIGFPGTSRDNEARYALDLLIAILGEGMSSRLFQEIREKRGLAYDIGAGTSHHADTGVVNIYAAVDSKKYNDAVHVISEEVQKLKTNTHIEELDKVKSLYKGRMKLNMENTRSVATWNCNQLLHGSASGFQSPEEFIEKISQVDLENIRNAASQYLSEEDMNVAVVGPVNPHDDPYQI